MTLRDRLQREEYDVQEAGTGAAGLELLRDEEPDLVLLDYRLPDMTGIDVLRQIRDLHLDTTVILLTAFSSIGSAVEAMKLGAHDYLNKPVDFDDLMATIAKALETTRLRREVRRHRGEQERLWGITNIVGRSQAIQDILVMIRKIAESAASTVLVRGESGTGKDLVAKAIHYTSDRSDKPFMNITCTAIPEPLLESELFGHERGSFTDARQLKKGLLEAADGGTVFLDEIGDMGPRPAVEGAALPRGQDLPPGRRLGGHPGGRAGDRRHEPRPRAGRQGGEVPRGPVLPPEGDPDLPALPEGAQGGHPGPREPLPGPLQPGVQEEHDAGHARRDGVPRGATAGPATSASSRTSSSA